MRLLLALLAWSASASAQSSFCDRITAITAEPAVAAAHWGVSVAALDGTVLCEVNAAQLFRPGSADKIFTSAAALALLGPEHTFRTAVVAEGTISGHTLTGNLVLKGGGDPAFGSPPPQTPETASIADLDELAARVAATGLRTVSGDLVGDDTYFTRPLYPPNWAADDLLYGFGAPVSALTVHDNQVLVKVAPAAAGSKALVSVAPGAAYYQLNNAVLSAGEGAGCDANLRFERAAHVVAVTGTIPPASKAPCVQALALDDPAQYGADAFKEALERHGVHVAGASRVRSLTDAAGSVLSTPPGADFMLDRMLQTPGPKSIRCAVQRVRNPGDAPDPLLTTLATHTSGPLLVDLTHTVKTSQNLHAELYLREVGATLGCEHSLREALYTLRKFILLAGVVPADFVLYDGSGLSDHDLVTPRAFTKFLAFAAAQPWFAQWKPMLPVGGVDGTLAARFTGALKGKVSAKTGTLGESRALAGYLTAASGQTVVFSILTDTHLPSNTADRAAADRMVEAIAAAN